MTYEELVVLNNKVKEELIKECTVNNVLDKKLYEQHISRLVKKNNRFNVENNGNSCGFCVSTLNDIFEVYGSLNIIKNISILKGHNTILNTFRIDNDLSTFIRKKLFGKKIVRFLKKTKKELEEYKIKVGLMGYFLVYSNEILLILERSTELVLVSSEFLQIGSHTLFRGMSNLEYLYIENISLKGITSIAHYFSDCYNLKEIVLKNFDTSHIFNMRSMFRNCYKLEKLNVDMFDTSSCITMVGMFAGCHSLKFLDLSKFNTTNLKNIKEMFKDCISLEKLNIMNWVLSKDCEVAGVFTGCLNINVKGNAIRNLNENPKYLLNSYYI